MMSDLNPITKDLLHFLGFQESESGVFEKLAQTPVTGYPTKIQVRPGHEGMLRTVFIEQAEYTGHLANGLGESDWTWESPAACIHLQIHDADALMRLVEIVFGDSSYGNS